MMTKIMMVILLVLERLCFIRNCLATIGIRIILEHLKSALSEGVSLCAALELDIVVAEIISLKKINPATYLGKGKLEDMSANIQAHDIELVVANCELSPGQQRNLERELNVKVIDRTGLILEIFGEPGTNQRRCHAGGTGAS